MAERKQPETVWQRTVRKFSAEPLVPIGTLITAGCLLAGFRAYRDGNVMQSQQLMRGRVLAQGVTVLIMVIGGGVLGLKPFSKPASYEEKMNQVKDI